MSDNSRVVNVFVTSFSGLGLPPTLSLPVETSLSIEKLGLKIQSLLPRLQNRLIITTTSNVDLRRCPQAPISSLLQNETDTFIPLRLSVPLCGGKGGFGSQLRAAGGRMSSKKKKNRDDHGSSRNLDGRRLRTVTEAKALAQYLAVKPEMDKREKEARRERWQQVIQLAEEREQEIKSGSRGKVDGQWVEQKEEAAERTRNAVQVAMQSADYQDHYSTSKDNHTNNKIRLEDAAEDSQLERAVDKSDNRSKTEKNRTQPLVSYHGFEEEDDESSEESGYD